MIYWLRLAWHLAAAIDVGKPGLDIARFARNVIEASKTVTDAKAHCAEVHRAWQPGITPDPTFPPRR
jgi:hypothetical protein